MPLHVKAQNEINNRLSWKISIETFERCCFISFNSHKLLHHSSQAEPDWIILRTHSMSILEHHLTPPSSKSVKPFSFCILKKLYTYIRAQDIIFFAMKGIKKVALIFYGLNKNRSIYRFEQAVLLPPYVHRYDVRSASVIRLTEK